MGKTDTTMQYCLYLFGLCLMIATANAQSPYNDTKWLFANFLLAPPNGTRCDYRADEGKSVYLQFNEGFRDKCYNISDFFDTNGRETYTCNPNNSTCPNDFRAGTLDKGGYDSSANYSVAYFSVSGGPMFPPGHRMVQPALLSIQAFDGPGCVDKQDVPWYQWGNCNRTSGDDCKHLPFKVGSLRIFETPEANRSGPCLIAAQRGAGMKNTAASVWAMSMAVFLGLLITY